MSVIEASSVRVQTMADGTLRLVCDIEPRNAQAAFQLFASPGTPMALAALKQTKLSAVPVGPNCVRAVTLCQDPLFWKWIHFASMSNASPTSEREAAAIVRKCCQVQSRKEFDSDDEAQKRFLRMFDRPYMKWVQAQQATAIRSAS